MNYPVVFAPEAEEQVVALYNYIAKAASPDIAKRYTDGILSYCESFQSFPNRGYLRNDIRPGLRITHYKKRTIIAFQVGDERVSVLGVFYGGLDYETLLHDEPEDSQQSDLVIDPS